MDILATKRLTLRPVLPPDAGDIAFWIANPKVAMNLSRLPWPYTESDADSWIAGLGAGRDDLVFGIHRERLIGVVSIEDRGGSLPELGYWLAEPCWGHGYMTEAATALVAHAFATRAWDGLSSAAFEDNRASLAVQHKLGFRVTGRCLLTSNPRAAKVQSLKTQLSRADFESLHLPQPLRWAA